MPRKKPMAQAPSLGLSGQFTFSPSPATGPERFQFCVGEPLGAPAGAVHIKKSPSSGPSGPPTPFVPPGHFPLSGGIVLPPGRGKACGRPKAAPTAESGPGALARQSQAQFWNRNNSKFCKPRAQWPGLNSGKPLRFCAPEMLCLAQGVTPVNGVQGVCVIEAGTAKPCLSLCTHPLAALW